MVLFVSQDAVKILKIVNTFPVNVEFSQFYGHDKRFSVAK